MSREPTDVAGRLIASLEAEAEMIDRGEFTIDQTKARDKLRDYQLADPDAWVVLVVELAGLLGAKAVYFDYTEPELTRVHFRSAAFEPGQLAEPLSGVFAAADGEGSLGRARLRAWQKLAIATNALLGRAQRIELACLDSLGKGPRMRWAGDPDGKVELDSLERDSEHAGNHLSVAFGERDHVDRETQLLRRACQSSPILVMAGSEKLSFGWKSIFQPAEPDLDGQEPAPPPTHVIRDEEYRAIGLASLTGTTAPPRLRIQTNGVLAEDIELHGARAGFLAIADLDLARDLSQSQVLRDDAFDRMIRLVRETHDTLHE